MPHHQRGLMRRKCWRCQQHNLVESDGDAVGVVCELPKKWGWTLITPGTTHCPLTNKGGKFIDKGGSNRRSSKVQTTVGVSDP